MYRLFIFCLLLPAAVSVADTPDNAVRGLEIAREAEERMSGYIDRRGEAAMIIRTRSGDKAVRKLHLKSMKTEDGSRSLTLVETPKDVAGTALLTYSYDFEPDRQWLYMPALARVKRIAAGNRAGAFMGSDFSYADFTAQPVEKFDFELLREDALDGRPMYILERVPKPGTDTVYSRQVAWIDREHYRTFRVDYYNRAGQHLKTMRAEDFRRYADEQWWPDRMVMTNHLTGGTSTLHWHDIAFDTGFTDRDFGVDALGRAR